MSIKIFSADVFDKYVTIQDPHGKTRNLNHYDFFETFSKSLGLLDKFVTKEEEKRSSSSSVIKQYPDSFFFEVSQGNTKVMYLYHPQGPHRVTFIHEGKNLMSSLSKASGLSLSETTAKMYAAGFSVETDRSVVFNKLQLPNLVCKISMTKVKSKTLDKEDFYTVNSVFYGFTEEPRALAKVTKDGFDDRSNLKHVFKTLGNLPFTNTYPDGRLCYGENKVVSNVTEANFRDLERYIHFLTAVPYNFHLGSGNSSLSNAGNKAWKEYFLGQELLPENSTKEEVDKLRNACRGEVIRSLNYYAQDGYYLTLNWYSYLNHVSSFPYSFFTRR